MITVAIYQNPQGYCCGFDADDHGESIVCSAVSILTLNAVNSIERFTDAKFRCEYNEAGGYLSFRLTEKKSVNRDVALLLKSMVLGLEGIQSEYQNELKVEYKEVL